MSSETFKKKFLDQTLNIIKKKLKVILLLLVFILTILLVFLFYKDVQEKKIIVVAENYNQALIFIKQEKILESKTLLENVINEDHPFYSPMALYLLIDKNIVKDSQKIIVFFDKVLRNNYIDKENLNLIKIKKAIYLINLDNEKLIIETLNPIINSNSEWRNTAINLISEYFLSKNQNIKANEYIQLLKNQEKK